MKVIALFSGGLDSTLAVKLIQRQGITVEVLHFVIPFAKHANLKELTPWLERNQAQLNTKIAPIFLKEEFLEIVARPKFGYGKNFNPCLDCKILMLKQAKVMLKNLGASCIITGEVLGQRPMSQHSDALNIIERESGLKGLLLRPLSAKRLKPTIAEEKGLIDREKLCDFSGRARSPQLALAKELGVINFSWPAGGCLLTEKLFCRRIEDLLKQNQFTYDNVRLLRCGRYFRLANDSWLVVGRNQEDNNKIKEQFKSGDIYFEPKDIVGPSGLGRGNFSPETKKFAAQLIARYADSSEGLVEVKVFKGQDQEIIAVEKLDPETAKQFML